MRAAVNTHYGPADNVQLRTLPDPMPGAKEILVAVEAAAVTTADWRIRAAHFPGGLALVGRLMFGLLRPRQPVGGMNFAGTIRAIGPEVDRFAVGDRVVGIAPGGGAHAEALVLPQDGIVARTPMDLAAAEAAALPFGGMTAVAFMQDIARVAAGQRVLILGASGAVGGYAVQLAASAGAKVTAVGGPGSVRRLRALGAEQVIDYTAQPLDAEGRDYDLVFDTGGIVSFRDASALLKPDGLFLPLEFGMRDVAGLILRWFTRGPRIGLHVSGETRERLQALLDRVARGALRPVVGARYPLERIVEAHRLVESRHAGGTVVVEMTPADAVREVA